VLTCGRTRGSIGSVEVGSRYQFGKLVVGWEGDVTWGDITTTNAGPLGAGLLSRSLSTRGQLHRHRDCHVGINKNRVGWTVGTGLEWGFHQNWSVKVEYDYLDFGIATSRSTGRCGTLSFCAPRTEAAAVLLWLRPGEVQIAFGTKRSLNYEPLRDRDRAQL
jgi:opacity protein-like surface antigen